MIKAHINTIKNIFKLNSRVNRDEFWQFIFTNFLIGFLILPIVYIYKQLIIVMALFAIITYILISLLSVKRLHDLNKSGWWVLLHIILNLLSDINILMMIPSSFMGIVLFYWLIRKGNTQNNKYGAYKKDTDWKKFLWLIFSMFIIFFSVLGYKIFNSLVDNYKSYNSLSLPTNR